MDPPCPARPRDRGGHKAGGWQLQTDGTARIPACRGCAQGGSSAREGRAGWFLSRGVRGLRGAQPLSSEARRLLGTEGLSGEKGKGAQKGQVGQNPFSCLTAGVRGPGSGGPGVENVSRLLPLSLPSSWVPRKGSIASSWLLPFTHRLAGDSLSSSFCQTRLPILRTPSSHPACTQRAFMPVPIPRSVQGQAGWGFEQPGLTEGVPARGRRVGTG